MAIIKLTGFIGEQPRITPRLLPASGAQIAQSVRLESGELAPIRKPYLVDELGGALPGTVKTIYRHLGTWLHWPVLVHAVPGPVAQDRLYYTGDGVPKMRVSGTVYPLALPFPTSPVTATRVGTLSGIVAVRLYVYTFVTGFDEESEPNPVSNEVQVSPGNTVTLSGFQAAPAGRNITKQRIYRSQTGTAGGTNFYFVAERAVSAADFTDNIAVDQFNEPLPSLDYNAPPADLHNLVSMPNGMMAGISGKDLCFSEPYKPHAWPEKYRQTMDYEGMALGVYGTTIVVGTKGNPYLAGGNHPDTIVMEKLELNMPCLSGQGMVDLGYAVVYPSNDGLVMVQGGTATVPTAQLLTRDQWLDMEPSTFVCGQFYGRFFASYDYIDPEDERKVGTLMIDLTGEEPFLIRSPHRAEAFFYDVASSALFMAIDGKVYEWDSRLAVNDVMTWKSKAFLLPAPTSFGVILFEVDQKTDLNLVIAYEAALAAVQTANTALFANDLMGELNGAPVNTYAVNGDGLLAVPAGPQLSVNVYADGKLHAVVRTAGRMARLPGGKLAREWEIEVTGNTRVQDVAMAGTAQELRGA